MIGPPGLDFAAAERLLSESEIVDTQPVWHSSNYVFLATLAPPGGEPVRAIYKPHRGESPLWDFPDGLYQREVAAYQLAQLLGWPFVPPTVLREGPAGIGSLQWFIAHDPQAHFFVQRDSPELVPQLRRMAVYDVIANNADRKGGHCLLDPDGWIWGIDHGLCFHQQYKLRSVIWDWAGEAIEGPLLGDIDRVCCALEARSEESEALRGLISGAELAATVRRIRKLLASRALPFPGPERHYPWPLV